MSILVGVLSGGGTNTDPALSLGSNPSYYPVTSGLLDNISATEAQTGRTDYRCMYVFNNSETISIYDATLEITDKEDSESVIQIGIQEDVETQFISLLVSGTGSLGTGSFDVTVTPADGSPSTDVTVAWDSDPEVFGQNLETAINTVIDYVTVDVTNHNQTVTDGPYSFIFFQIEFLGDEIYRPQAMLALADDNMTIVDGPGSSIVYTFKELTRGGPLNAIASSIGHETTPPTNITFTSSPIELGTLRPLDGLAVWIKRIIPTSAEAFENDGFVLKVTGGNAS